MNNKKEGYKIVLSFESWNQIYELDTSKINVYIKSFTFDTKNNQEILKDIYNIRLCELEDFTDDTERDWWKMVKTPKYYYCIDDPEGALTI